MNKDGLIWVIIGLAVLAGLGAVLFLDTTGEKGSGLSDEYKYDVSEYGKTDQKLVLYRQLPEVVSINMNKTTAIDVDNAGRIYVAGDNRIERIDTIKSTGQGKKIIEVSDMPLCLDVDKDGKIYVGINDHIEVYDAEGKQIAKWECLGADAIPTSIAVGEKDVFLADAGRRVVVHYDLDGKIVNEIGRKDKRRNIDGFVIPSPYFDLAIAGDGLLRVVNPGMHRIEAYAFDGDLEFWWGKPGVDIEGFCGCCNPINFAILADGKFVTCEKGLTRVKVYDEEGKFVGVVAGADMLTEGPAAACQTPSDCQSGGFDVAADRSGKIYVLDTIDNVVKIFEKK